MKIPDSKPEARTTARRPIPANISGVERFSNQSAIVAIPASRATTIMATIAWM